MTEDDVDDKTPLSFRAKLRSWFDKLTTSGFGVL